MDVLNIYNYIGGEMVTPIQNQWLDNTEPACGTVYMRVPKSTSEDIDKAVQSALNASPTWGKMGAEGRAKYLRLIAQGIFNKLDDFVIAESKDTGKPIALARRMDIPRAISNFNFFADAITQFSSEAHSTSDDVINYTLRQPLGVVGCISPWNLPLYLLTWKIAPALAAGNCVIAKPSELSPYTAYLLSEVCIEVGLPEGVLNIIHGEGIDAGQPLCIHKEVKAISFTGGTSTGRLIASLSAPLFKKLSLELGGKNPAIIFNDCDWNKTLHTIVRSSFTNQGQICLCSSRILVQEEIFDRFIEEFTIKTQELSLGDPYNENTQIGAVISEAHMNKVLAFIDQAKQDGGTIHTGGYRVKLDKYPDGWYIAPTIITGLNDQCAINQEEIFGPVVSVMTFKDKQEALSIANGTAYGLAASVWTTNLNTAHYMSQHLESGIVWVNTWLLRDLRTPFGGVKQSGVGREGGLDVLRFFTETKNVCIAFDGTS